DRSLRLRERGGGHDAFVGRESGESLVVLAFQIVIEGEQVDVAVDLIGGAAVDDVQLVVGGEGAQGTAGAHTSGWGIAGGGRTEFAQSKLRAAHIADADDRIGRPVDANAADECLGEVAGLLVFEISAAGVAAHVDQVKVIPLIEHALRRAAVVWNARNRNMY